MDSDLSSDLSDYMFGDYSGLSPLPDEDFEDDEVIPSSDFDYSEDNNNIWDDEFGDDLWGDSEEEEQFQPVDTAANAVNDSHDPRNDDDDDFEVLDVNMANAGRIPTTRRNQQNTNNRRRGISINDYMRITGTRQAPRPGRSFRESDVPIDAEIIDLNDEDEEDEDEFGNKTKSLSTEQMLNSQSTTKVTFKKLRDFVCPICLAPPEIVAATPCGHMYCSDCVFKALSSTARSSEVNGECSICRRKVLYKKVTFLEFKIGNIPNV